MYKRQVVINPTFKEAVAEMGGELLEVAEVDGKKDTSGTSEDPQIKTKEKRAGQIKRQVLMKKLQAVRAGGGADITAGYEPEGEMVEDYETKKTGEVLAAFKRDPKVRKRFEKAAKKEDGPGSVKNRAADSMLQTAKDTAKRKGDTSKSDDRYAYESVEVDEGVMKMVKKVIRSKKPEKKAEKAMDAGAVARRKLQQKDHEKVNFLPVDEGKGYQPEIEHSKLGDAKKKADKERESKLPPHLQGDAIGKMKKAFASEDKAFNFVLDKIRKEVGKDGYVSKNNPRKPQSAADKAKVRAHQAKVDKENAAARAKDPSQGRYPKG